MNQLTSWPVWTGWLSEVWGLSNCHSLISKVHIEKWRTLWSEIVRGSQWSFIATRRTSKEKMIADMMSIILSSNAFYYYYFVLASYVCMRALQVLTTTPALASTNENKEVKTSRSIWLALHSSILSLRWGYGFLYILATILKGIRIGDQPGASLQGYVINWDY